MPRMTAARHVVSNTNTSCHIWMRRVTHERVMCAQIDAGRVSRIMQNFRFKYKCNISNIHYTFGHTACRACHIWNRRVKYEHVMSPMNASCHVMNASYGTYEWFRCAQIDAGRVYCTYVTYEWGMSRMNSSCHVWTSHVHAPCRVCSSMLNMHVHV